MENLDLKTKKLNPDLFDVSEKVFPKKKETKKDTKKEQPKEQKRKSIFADSFEEDLTDMLMNGVKSKKLSFEQKKRLFPNKKIKKIDEQIDEEIKFIAV